MLLGQRRRENGWCGVSRCNAGDGAAQHEHNCRCAAAQGEEAEELELIYNADHLAAVVKPVALTMAIASYVATRSGHKLLLHAVLPPAAPHRWVVANIRERAEEEALREGLSVYLVYDDNSNSGGQGGGKNGLAAPMPTTTNTLPPPLAHPQAAAQLEQGPREKTSGKLC